MAEAVRLGLPGSWQIVGTILFLQLTYILVKGWPSRRLFYKLKQQGLVSWNPNLLFVLIF